MSHYATDSFKWSVSLSCKGENALYLQSLPPRKVSHSHPVHRRAWTSRGELDPSRDCKAIAIQILAERTEQARMHGYPSYACYATADTMAGKEHTSLRPFLSPPGSPAHTVHVILIGEMSSMSEAWRAVIRVKTVSIINSKLTFIYAKMSSRLKLIPES